MGIYRGPVRKYTFYTSDHKLAISIQLDSIVTVKVSVNQHQMF